MRLGDSLIALAGLFRLVAGDLAVGDEVAEARGEGRRSAKLPISCCIDSTVDVREANRSSRIRPAIETEPRHERLRPRVPRLVRDLVGRHDLVGMVVVLLEVLFGARHGGRRAGCSGRWRGREKGSRLRETGRGRTGLLSMSGGGP
jgi:hypothetical protein